MSGWLEAPRVVCQPPQGEAQQAPSCASVETLDVGADDRGAQGLHGELEQRAAAAGIDVSTAAADALRAGARAA